MYQLLEHNIVGVGSDPISQLSAAWLKVKANIILLEGNLNDTPSTEFRREHGSRASQLWLKIEEKYHPATAQFDEAAIIKLLTSIDCTNIGIVSMPILRTHWVSESGQVTNQFKIQGLVLHYFGDNPEHLTGLTRIGRFTIASEDQALWKFFQDLTSSDNQKEFVLL
jgi:hypothetical protein